MPNPSQTRHSNLKKTVMPVKPDMTVFIYRDFLFYLEGLTSTSSTSNTRVDMGGISGLGLLRP